jgi:hypothetical protein
MASAIKSRIVVIAILCSACGGGKATRYARSLDDGGDDGADARAATSDVNGRPDNRVSDGGISADAADGRRSDAIALDTSGTSPVAVDPQGRLVHQPGARGAIVFLISRTSDIGPRDCPFRPLP